MVELQSVLDIIGVIIAAPLLVGLLMGVDRKITARMQARRGPPIWQPYYDIIKLLGKDRKLINSSQALFAYAALLLQAFSLALLAAGGDLVVVFFMSAAGCFCFVLGAFSARSPFSHLGAQRELLQILAYEPVLFMFIFLIGLWQGGFMAQDVRGQMLTVLPFMVLALIPVLLIKAHKSPFDIAVAKTEIASGPYVEYSGSYLAVTEYAHWIELAIVFGFISLLYADPDPYLNVIGKLLLIFVLYFVVIVIDNVTTRLTRRSMVTFTLAFGILMGVLNLIWMYLIDKGVLPWA
ncbi:MAG: NADH-quinone oxidoreductase subunit H [Methanomassiliicoccales archaeon]